MKRATPWILLLFTLSGVSGLVYQIVWIRQLSHLLGGTSYAISTVLAAFMGGLALGSRFFGDRADRSTRLLRLYAWLELGIAALGGLVYLIIRVAPPAYAGLAQALPGSTLGVLRVLITLLLLVPPTFLMGGTLPILSRYIVRDPSRLGRGLGLLYGVNTFGAVLGSFLAGFVLVSTLGTGVSTALAILINLFICGVILLIDRSGAGEVPPVSRAAAAASPGSSTAAAPEAPAEMNWLLLALLFAASGFASLGYELYWTRGLKHFLGNSTYAFSTMLTTFLLGLAFGGWLGGRLVDRVKSPARLLGWIQLGVGATVLGTVFLIWDWLPRLNDAAFFSHQSLNWNSYLLRRFAVAVAVMMVPTFLTGMTFPVVNRIGIRGLSKLGHGVGSLYFSNTLGAILGSLAAGFVILPLIGAKTALVATGVFSALLGVIAHLGNRQRGAYAPWAALAVFIGLLVASPTLRDSGRDLLSDTQDPEDRVVFQQEDHAGETRVYRKNNNRDLHMSVDGHHIGGSEAGILRKEKILAHLPMMLVPEARNSLSVGLGSGITLGTLSLYEEIEALSCVEIVPGVVKGARRFRRQNFDVLDDPRLSMHVGDGVQFLLTTPERYDIISSDSKLNPEFSGNAPLLSLNYYELCAERLSDKGVMVQWLAAHLPNSELEVVVRSFTGAFPHAALYYFDAYSLILAGSKAPLVFDFDAARDYTQREALAADLEALILDDPYVAASIFQTDRAGLMAATGEGDINTWEHPRLEFSMAREFRRKQTPYHEDETLRWMVRLRNPSAQTIVGDYDPEIMARYQASGGKLLDAFASGGGINRLETGLSHLEEGLALNPADRRLSIYQESIQIIGERLETALDEGRIQTPEELTRLGLSRLDAGNNREALEFFDRALAIQPGDPSLLYNRLRCLRELNEWATLREALTTFRADFPRDARGYSMWGRLLAREGDIEGALREFEQAVELDSKSPVYINNLATSLARLERYAEAGERFAQVCELQPDYFKAAYFAAASYSMAGQTAAAARWALFAIDQGLEPAERFAEDEFFENLRNSEHWDATRGEPVGG